MKNFLNPVFKSFLHREEDFFHSSKQHDWLVTVAGLHLLQIYTRREGCVSATSQTRLHAHMQGLLLPGGPSGPCQVSPQQWDLCTGQCCAQRLCWKGTTRHLKDILRLRSIVPDFQAEQLIYVVYSDCSLGSAGLWTSPSCTFLSPLCFCPIECGIKIRLFIYLLWIYKSL